MIDDVLFYGDPHGNFEPLFVAVQDKTPKAVVILGDFGLTQSLEKTLAPVLEKTTNIFWIPGNHDNDTVQEFDYLFNSLVSQGNLHAKVQDVCGVRIAGLGGIFKGRIWFPKTDWDSAKFNTRYEYLQSLGKNEKWRDGLPLPQRVTIFPEDAWNLLEEKCDILISHEASALADSRGFFVINDIAQRMGAKVTMHGHLHTSYIKQADSGMLCIGCGKSQALWGSEFSHWLEPEYSAIKP